MAYIKIPAVLLLTLSILGCDDSGKTPATSVQQTPAPELFQAISAIEQLKLHLLDNPNDFAALSALGDEYFESRRYLEAIQAYDRALAVNPLSADCYNDKGLALYYTGNVEPALAAFEAAIDADGEYVHAWLSKGFVLMSQERYQEAVAPLNRVKELDGTGRLAAEADRFFEIIAERTGR